MSASAEIPKAATPDAEGPVAGRREQIATRLTFFVAGFGVAAWGPVVPFVKARAGLDDATLGLLLLCLGLGSLLTMPLAGVAARRFGCRAVILTAGLLVCATLPLLALLSAPSLLAVTLFLFGAGIGAIDCVVNVQAVIVERDSGRTMMSGFHGLYSVGGIAGAGGMALALSLGATPPAAVLVAVLCILAALLWAAPGLLPYAGRAAGPAFALPRGPVLFIGSLAFIVFLAEGSVLDWGAVFLSSVRGLETSLAGLGFTAFATAMTLGRLTGDAIVRRLGPTRVLLFGGGCAALGFALTALVPSWQVGIAGYAIVGLGCANIAPVLFSAVGRQSVMPEHIAVPAITTLGYAGVLSGPAAVGFVAQATSLPIAFLLIALALAGLAVSGRLLRV